MHYFSTAFLADMAARMRAEARYHLARKAIPSASGPVQVGVMRVLAFRVQGVRHRAEVRYNLARKATPSAPGAMQAGRREGCGSQGIGCKA